MTVRLRTRIAQGAPCPWAAGSGGSQVVSGALGGRQGLDGLPEELLGKEDLLPGEVQGVWWLGQL